MVFCSEGCKNNWLFEKGEVCPKVLYQESKDTGKNWAVKKFDFDPKNKEKKGIHSLLNAIWIKFAEPIGRSKKKGMPLS